MYVVNNLNDNQKFPLLELSRHLPMHNGIQKSHAHRSSTPPPVPATTGNHPYRIISVWRHSSEKVIKICICRLANYRPNRLIRLCRDTGLDSQKYVPVH